MATNTVDSEVERLLNSGKEAAKTGDVAQARDLLTQVVERDPHNEQAWMWLSGMVNEPEEQQICLENVLVINPYNSKARQGLEFLSAKTGIPPHAPPVPSEYTAPLSPELADYAELHDSISTQGAGNGGIPMPDWNESQGMQDGPFNMFGEQEAGLPAEGFPVAGMNLVPGFDGAVGGVDPAPGVNGLDIDWSRGFNLEPAPTNNPGFGADNPPQQPYDFSGGAYNMPGVYGEAAGGDYNLETSMPPWSLDIPAGFEPMQPGTFNGGHDGAFAQNGVGTRADSPVMDGFSPMGPAGDFQLPQPHDLPGFDVPAQSGQPEAKPWYALSTRLTGALQHRTGGLNGIDPNNSDELTQHLGDGKSPSHELVECPNCKEQVVDTALACPTCNYRFFINCPRCHELVDTLDATPGAEEPCPNCGVRIDKMQLGMVDGDPSAAYVSQKLARVSTTAADAPAMQQYMAAAVARRGFSWAWIVDLMWLAALIAMVWAFTQLPTWLHLAGQY